MDSTRRKKDLSTNVNHETAMDAFLGKLGLYRKPIAKDGSCLFRAVAEQVFNCQAEHSNVRKECIEFLKKNKEKFEAFVEGPFDHHLFNLKSEKEWAGQVEIHALSLMYKCDFFVYQAIDAPPIRATENNYDKKIMLCYSNGNHYDSIYPIEHQKNLAFCQSIVFELLYGKVFPRIATTETVNKPAENLDQLEKQSENCSTGYRIVNGYGSENGEHDEEGWTTVKNRKQGKASVKNQKHPVDSQVDPSKVSPVSANNSKLHWEIMRSVDPDGYRNIELEVWEEMRKEQQQKDQTVAATMQFRKGDKCYVRHPSDGRSYVAVIDEVFERTCKIWIHDLKERKVLSFSCLIPIEHGGNSGYRELSGYHRKAENTGEAGTRGNEDQKTGRRRRPNRNRKGNGNDSFERSQQEGHEEQSGRQRGEKNRRRRNGNPRAKEEKKESRIQGENGNNSQDQGFFEISEKAFPAFPALPGNPTQSETEKPKSDVDSSSNPATFWSKLHAVPTADTAETVNSPSLKSGCSLSEDRCSDENGVVSVEKPEEIPVNHLEADQGPLNSQDEKHVFWQETSADVHVDDNPFSSDVAKEYESTSVDANVDNRESSVESSADSSATPLGMMNGLPDRDVFEANSEVTFSQDQSHGRVNGVLYTQGNNHTLELMENTTSHVEEEQFSSSNPKTDYEKAEYPQEEQTIEQTNGGEAANTEVINQHATPNESSIPFENNFSDNYHQPEDAVPPKVPQEPNHHPISLADIQNEILNGNITYSRDPEGKDLPKDMEVLRHFYNFGVQSYFYGMNTVYPGGQPLSPVYPVMSPTGPMYTTIHQAYQNQPIIVPQNMRQYPPMQAPQSQEENQHQPSPGEERREGSPGYKQNIPPHQSSQYHHQHPMAQAMFNLNFGQLYQRHMYPNYNMFSPRPSFQRYPQNKTNFNRPSNRKSNRYSRNDNPMKSYNVPSGYGSDSKSAE